MFIKQRQQRRSTNSH